MQQILSDLLSRFVKHGELMKLVIFKIIKSANLVENESKRVHKLQESLCSIIDQALEEVTNAYGPEKLKKLWKSKEDLIHVMTGNRRPE